MCIRDRGGAGGSILFTAQLGIVSIDIRMPGGSRRQLVALNMEHLFAVGSIGHGGDHPAVPIEVVGGNRARSVGKIRRGGGYICLLYTSRKPPQAPPFHETGHHRPMAGQRPQRY